MKYSPNEKSFDWVLIICVLFLILFGNFVLFSIAPYLFPGYLIYVLASLIVFYFVLKVDFEVWQAFANYLYIASIVLLLLTLLIGRISRGALRWINFGTLSIQPAEIVRPLLIIFFASFLNKSEINFRRIILLILLVSVPIFLIAAQPSLGVALVTLVAFIGVLLASKINKRRLVIVGMLFGLLSIFLLALLAPYQISRITAFLNPMTDPLGAGYNSIQSQIAIGAGQIFGRGFGKGMQTQLSFLPERQTDFIFASISEELGFVGAVIVIVAYVVMLFRLSGYLESPRSMVVRSYVSGCLAAIIFQLFINLAMNMGLVPITGLPLPLVSAGGSSLLSTLVMLAIVMKTR